MSWLLACDGSSFDDRGCLHQDLDDWCLHSESADGPEGEGTCEDPEANPSYRCGDYDIDVSSGGFTSESYYFEHTSGELVAVAYGTDTNTYCGGFTYWYGRRVKCDLECSYLADDDDLPPCD